MDWLQIITLAIIQGITEFLPISSSAHLILPAQLSNWPDQGLAFDVAVHAGTLTAVCWYFRHDLMRYSHGTALGISRRTLNPELEEVAKLAAATAPVVICGYLLKDWVSLHLRSITVIAITTTGFAVLLALADRRRGEVETISWHAALVIGASQVLALAPGTSRSGITITAALWLGLSRTTAARFSFLLAIPAIAGAALLTTLDLATAAEPVEWLQLLTGAALAALSAYLGISGFLGLVERSGLMPYVWYRLVLGGVLFWIVLGG